LAERLTILFFKKLLLLKSKELKTRFNLAASSKEGYGSERTALSVMMIMMIIMGQNMFPKDYFTLYFFIFGQYIAPCTIDSSTANDNSVLYTLILF
jgi:hypothetical protein